MKLGMLELTSMHSFSGALLPVDTGERVALSQLALLLSEANDRLELTLEDRLCRTDAANVLRA
jgi:hypothetical protein